MILLTYSEGAGTSPDQQYRFRDIEAALAFMQVHNNYNAQWRVEWETQIEKRQPLRDTGCEHGGVVRG